MLAFTETVLRTIVHYIYLFHFSDGELVFHSFRPQIVERTEIRFMHPLRPGKKLCVLDLDLTLFDMKSQVQIPRHAFESEKVAIKVMIRAAELTDGKQSCAFSRS